MRKRILCPKHKEATPSCILYENGYHCFGCGASGPLTDLGIDEVQYEPEEKYVEDVKASITCIEALPTQSIRGLELHADAYSYYIIWPDRSYYKRRFVGATSNSDKYRCPIGVTKPLLVLPGGTRTIFFVEGEINALSASLAEPAHTYICPGGAGDFYGRTIEKRLAFLEQYGTVVIVTDKDKAGTIAAIKLKALCLPYAHDVRIELVEQDFNEILVKRGKEYLKHQINSYLDL